MSWFSDEASHATVGATISSMFEYLQSAFNVLNEMNSERIAERFGAFDCTVKVRVVPFLWVEDMHSANKKFSQRITPALIRFPYCALFTASDDVALTNMRKGLDLIGCSSVPASMYFIMTCLFFSHSNAIVAFNPLFDQVLECQLVCATENSLLYRTLTF